MVIPVGVRVCVRKKFEILMVIPVGVRGCVRKKSE